MIPGMSSKLATPPTSKSTHIVAIANQKGGVGKTTTTINLAMALAISGRKVLLIDLDSQGNASTGLGFDKNDQDALTTYDLLSKSDVTLENVSRETFSDGVIIKNLKICPASINLAGFDLESIDKNHPQFILREKMSHLTTNYDFILIDCPPALGMLTVNALVASDQVLVPLQAEFYALEGLSHLLKTVEKVKKNLNPKLSLQGILLTMVDKRNNLARQVEQDVRQHFGEKVYQALIPRNTKIAEAPSHGKPALLYDYRSTGAMAYLTFAKEFMRRFKTKEA